jgi:dimethylargininase
MHKQNYTRCSHAIVRTPGHDFAHGITTSNLGTPSYELILKQHQEYIQTLRYLGLKVIVLNPLPNYPDAYFVEDDAVVTPDVAIITNPGAEDRKGEVATIEPVLATYRDIARIRAPGTVDGGDILMMDSHFFIGISERTNREGAEQLSFIFEQYGYTWALVYVEAGLHLKSSVNFIGNNTLLLTENFADLYVFKGYNHIIVDNAEGYAANTLLIRDSLLTPKGFPNTLGKLASTGFNIIELDMSEARKMDGGLTCMSLRF